MEYRLIKIDVVTSLILAFFTDLTTQTGIIDMVDLSQCPQQCHHHGDCVTKPDRGFECQCHHGWGGDTCSRQCDRPCRNGHCVFSGSKQVCLCALGFHGIRCEHPDYRFDSLIQIAKAFTQRWDKAMPLVKDPTRVIEQNIQRGSSTCTSNFRCQNGGKCKRGAFGGYKCECDVSRYTGTFCQLACPDRCLNGGKCVRIRKTRRSFDASSLGTLPESETIFKCVCKDGFFGSKCQKGTNSLVDFTTRR